MQLAVARDALAAFGSITESGTIVPTSHVWSEPWRDEARELADHRSERHGTPQYQNEDDQNAAVAAHGEDAACGVC